MLTGNLFRENRILKKILQQDFIGFLGSAVGKSTHKWILLNFCERFVLQFQALLSCIDEISAKNFST